jgi:hypothetical protein
MLDAYVFVIVETSVFSLVYVRAGGVLVVRRVIGALTVVKVRVRVAETVFTCGTVTVWGDGLMRIVQAALISHCLYPRRYGGFLTSWAARGTIV